MHWFVDPHHAHRSAGELARAGPRCLRLGLRTLGESEQPIAAGDTGESGADPLEPNACAGGAAESDAAVGECQFVARGLCFSTSEAACACAGCGADDCAIAESFPAQAFCPSSGSPDPDGSTSDDPNTPVSSDPHGGGSNGYPGTGEPQGGGSNGSVGSAGCGDAGHGGQVDPSQPAACSAGVPRDPTGGVRCDFIVGEACFDSAASACTCAGCAADHCLVLESYPAQIRCE
jgi:hypothetical protein